MANLAEEEESISILEDKNSNLEDKPSNENKIETSMEEVIPVKVTSMEEVYKKPKAEVFKKPVLLIGPRKGKTVGKIQILKSSESPNTPSEAQELPSEDVQREITDNSVTAVDSVQECPAEVNKVQKLSPAQTLKEHHTFPYKEPKWSGIPKYLYKLEVLKHGSIMETIDLSSKPFIVFGRSTNCDIHSLHPTVSRFHAVLQYRRDGADGTVGFYLYDLGSVHGTYLNKYRIKSFMYVRIHVGHLVKLGGSSRMYILQGPEEDMEKESELSVTELKEKRKEEQIAKETKEIQELEEQRIQQEKAEADGIDWGMGDDADEETDLSENPFAAAPNEELYLDDPKKTLRGWFEREGYDLEYDVEEKGFGQFLCRVELPVESVKGGTIIAESLVKGKKKEAVVQCALEACRVLDRYGLLRQAKHESRKRKVKNWEENDYYDSDEDEFLDRTGTVEKKRQQRMKAAGKLETHTETYESLVKKHEEILSQIDKNQTQLDDIINKKGKNKKVTEDEDALDAFMTNLSSEVPDDKLISKLKSEILSLRKEEVHVRKLVNIACPASLPKLVEQPAIQPLQPPSTSSLSSSSQLRNKLSIGPKRKALHSLESDSSKVKINKLFSDVEHKEKEEGVEDVNEMNEKDFDRKEINIVIESESKVNKEEDRIASEASENDSHLKEVEDDSSNPKPKGCSNLSPEKMQEISSETKEGDIEQNPEKNTKVIGPKLPEDFISDAQVEKRKKRSRQKQNKKTGKEQGNHSSDPNYSMWVPPEDQSGDGRTKLNEKYGY